MHEVYSLMDPCKHMHAQVRLHFGRFVSLAVIYSMWQLSQCGVAGISGGNNYSSVLGNSVSCKVVDFLPSFYLAEVHTGWINDGSMRVCMYFTLAEGDSAKVRHVVGTSVDDIVKLLHFNQNIYIQFCLIWKLSCYKNKNVIKHVLHLQIEHLNTVRLGYSFSSFEVGFSWCFKAPATQWQKVKLQFSFSFQKEPAYEYTQAAHKAFCLMVAWILQSHLCRLWLCAGKSPWRTKDGLHLLKRNASAISDLWMTI